MNYAMIVFLRTPELAPCLDNFKLIAHLYYISICNGFGIADTQMLRIGTALYYPSVSHLYIYILTFLNEIIELHQSLMFS